MQAIRISVYLLAFTLSNLIVQHLGAQGLIITALLLIPFDFVMRCVFHEQWSGIGLIIKLGALTVAAGFITYLINKESINVVMGSIAGYTGAQITAGIAYQILINKSYLAKVNLSDVVAIVSDSILFQLVAFSEIDQKITLSQILLKIIGGLFWYYIIFRVIKFKPKVNDKS